MLTVEFLSKLIAPPFLTAVLLANKTCVKFSNVISQLSVSHSIAPPQSAVFSLKITVELPENCILSAARAHIAPP